MTKLRAKAKLVENYRIDVDDQKTHALCLDQPPPDGTDMGPSALDLCLMSYAGCYATIFVLTAKKMRFSLKNMEINVEAVKSEAAGTITEATVDVLVETDMPKDRLRRAHELTVRNCPVGKLFEKAGVKMKYNLRNTKE
ncbi:MAG: OsmC family protein [Candidatus Bathyarchaeia archaeon]|jgi:putative redox protein